jgi:hypothetical protein
MRNFVFSLVALFLGMFAMTFLAQMVVIDYLDGNFVMAMIAGFSASFGFAVTYAPQVDRAWGNWK